ncbi:response regulator transcription factor [Serratia ureilytica]|nr:response regulator transcription factor [Serratia ureilytica]
MRHDEVTFHNLHYADCEKLMSYNLYQSNFDEIIISVYSYKQLAVIDKILSCKNDMKLVVIVYDERSQMLKLLLSLGVRFIVSHYDSMSRLNNAIKNKNLDCFITPRFYCTIKKFEQDYVLDLKNSLVTGKPILTKRERRIIISLLSGYSTWDLSKKFNCSIKTVSAHKINALKKLRERSINKFFL